MPFSNTALKYPELTEPIFSSFQTRHGTVKLIYRLDILFNYLLP